MSQTDEDDVLEIEDDAPAAPEPEPAEPDDADEPVTGAGDDDLPEPPRPRRRERDEKRWKKLTAQLSDKDRELEALRQRLQERDQQTLQRDVEGLKTRHDDLKKKLREAREAGDTDAELEIEEELADVRLRRSSIAIVAENERRQREQAQGAGAAPPVSEDEQRAQARIQQWARDSEFPQWTQAEQQAAIGVETVIAGKAKRGSDAYYRQLASRLKAVLPDRAKEIDYATRRQVRARPRPSYDDDDVDAPEQPAARAIVRRGSVPPAADDGGEYQGAPIALTRQQLRTMERFGFEPGNKAHVAEYAKQLRRHGLA